MGEGKVTYVAWCKVRDTLEKAWLSVSSLICHMYFGKSPCSKPGMHGTSTIADKSDCSNIYPNGGISAFSLSQEKRV